MRTSKHILALSFSALFTVLGGCGGSSYDGSRSGTSPIQTGDVQEVSCSGVIPGQVQIVGRVFSPSSETILQNQIVKFENNDAENHTVTSGVTGAATNNFDITLTPGQERCLLFKRAGSFPYFCRLHPEMRGEIVVR